MFYNASNAWSLFTVQLVHSINFPRLDSCSAVTLHVELIFNEINLRLFQNNLAYPTPIPISEKRYQFWPRNTKIYKICKLRRAIFSAFYSIFLFIKVKIFKILFITQWVHYSYYFVHSCVQRRHIVWRRMSGFGLTFRYMLYIQVKDKFKSEGKTWDRAMNEVRLERLKEEHGENCLLVIVRDWPNSNDFKDPGNLASLERLVSKEINSYFQESLY